jgi:CRP-like cAMP-binding protein
MHGRTALPYDPDHMRPETPSFAFGLPAKVRILKDGEHLFAMGQRPSRLYFLVDGTVQLVRPLKNGATAVMHRAGAGDWIAESSIFSEKYHCDAIAVGAARVRGVRKAELLELFARDPARCLEFAQTLALRLRQLRGAHEIVRIRGAEERVAHWLSLQAEGSPPTVVLDRTWSQIADELALTREAVYRALSSMRASDAIRVSGKTVVLKRS